MDIIALDYGLRIIAGNDKFLFPTNQYQLAYKQDASGIKTQILIQGTDLSNESLVIDDITKVDSITDSRTGGPGVIAVPASITLLFDTIEGFIFTISGAAAVAGLATEATLLSLLSNVIDTQDVEIKLVRDTGDSDIIVQQIRSYDQGTELWTTTYEKADGSAHTVIGPLVYQDASAVLNLILAELQNESNLEKLRSQANDLVETATYYAGIEAGNPSGSVDNIKTIVYSSAALVSVPDVTKTLTWDENNKYLTSTLS